MGEIHFHLSAPKHEFGGEDAPPILEVEDRDHYTLGVFDGLGGSGARKLTFPWGERSSAWAASRAVRDSLSEFPFDAGPDDPAATAAAMTATIREALAGNQGRPVDSALKSRLLRELPTTMALARVIPGDDTLTINTYWAGDSRVFVLTDDDGLMQLTSDHLRTGGDAMDNLADDAPMSNVISASHPFYLSHSSVKVSSRFVFVVAATDGCYDYYATPAHFEEALLRTMNRSVSPAEWAELLEEELSARAADDASLSCIGLGLRGWREVRRGFAGRRMAVKRLLAKYEKDNREIDRLEARVSLLRHTVESTKQQVWRDYKAGYERYLPTEG